MTDIESLICALEQATAELDRSAASDAEVTELVERVAQISVKLGSCLDDQARQRPASHQETQTE